MAFDTHVLAEAVARQRVVLEEEYRTMFARVLSRLEERFIQQLRGEKE